MKNVKIFPLLLNTVSPVGYDSGSNTFQEFTLFFSKYSLLLLDTPSENNFSKRQIPSSGELFSQNPNGARYLDAKYSRWLSTDSALSSYVERNYEGPSGGIYNSVNLNLYHYGGNNPVKYTDPDGCETMIIGVSVSKNGIDLFGQHSFIMLLNDKAPSQNIMLDASGHFYANQHFNDVLRESAIYPRSISLNSYKNYWKGEKEYLFTFTIELDDKQSSEFRTLIEKEDSERTWLTCATKSSRVLHKSELFKSIRETSKPKKLLKQLSTFFTTSELKVKIECHDLETTNSKEIKLKKTEDNK